MLLPPGLADRPSPVFSATSSETLVKRWMTSSKRVSSWTISSLTGLASSSATRQLSGARRAALVDQGAATLGAAAVGRAVSGDSAHPPTSAAVGRPAGADLLEVWSVWLDLRYAVYATPEPEGAATTRGIGAARWPTGPARPTPTGPASTPASAWSASTSEPLAPRRRPAPSCWSCASASPTPCPGQAPPLLISTVDLR